MPAPKTSTLKAAEGNRSKLGRARIKTDPVGKGRPEIPPSLSPEAKRFWAIIVESLPKGLLSRADEGTLEVYVSAWSRYREARRHVMKNGYWIGNRLNPMKAIQDQAAAEMHKVGGTLGLSPLARARLATEGQTGEEDPLALLLGEDLDPAGAWSDKGRAN